MHRMTGLTVALAFAGSLAFAATEGHWERTLNVSGPLNLELQTDSGGIVVNAGAAGTLQVRAILKANSNWMAGTTSDIEARIRRIEQNPPIEQNGNTVRVGRLTDRSLLKGISMRLEVTAPAETKLYARTDSGGIRAEGIKGPVDAKTDSGGIHAVRIGGEVRAEADSGGIHISGAQGSVWARVDSGGVEAMDVAGSVDAQTDSGGVRIAQTKAAAIRARTDSGGVHVKLASGAGYDIHAEGDSAHVSVPQLDGGSSVTKHSARGRIRGGGPLVDVKANSGTVTIE
jgi:hypothetical protein